MSSRCDDHLSPLLCFSYASFPHIYVFWGVPTGSKGLPGVPGYQGTHGLPGDPSTAKGQHGDPGAEGLPGIKGMPGLTGNRGISGFGGMPGYKVSRSLDGSSTKRSHRRLSPHPSLLPGSAGSVWVRSTFADAGFPQQLCKLSSEAFIRKRDWIKYKSTNTKIYYKTFLTPQSWSSAVNFSPVSVSVSVSV